MTERAFYNVLRSRWKPVGVDLQRIETATGPGVPDVNYCYRGIEGWLELKRFSKKKREGTFKIPHLRDAQCAWLRRRREAGGRAALLCLIDRDVLLLDGRWAYPTFRGELTWADVSLVGWWSHYPVAYGELLLKLTCDSSEITT